MSDIQIQWFKSAAETFNDGTFGYAPAGFKQIYRIFGLFKKTQCRNVSLLFFKIRKIIRIPKNFIILSMFFVLFFTLIN
jgi:hypothetical protein